MISKRNILCLSLCALAIVGCGTNGSNSNAISSVEPVAGPKGDKGDKGDTGDKGDKGDTGEKGDNGSSVLTGTGAPADSLGTDGDSYIDLNTYDFYTKQNGSWTKVGNIKGADGFDGMNGNKGQDGKNGLSVLSGNGEPADENGVDGDLYLDTATYNLYKKNDGSWEKIGNIKGDKGDKGTDATLYYSNSFLPSEGGYIYSDKGSYAVGETIKLNATSKAGYSLKSIEVIYDGVKSVYTVETGLNDLLTNGLVAKENGYVFLPVFASEAKTFQVTSTEDLAKIGEQGDGIYSLSEDSYGTSVNGVTLTSSGEMVDVVGKTDENGKPATTIYVNGKSSFASRYFTLENVNIVLADDYSDTTSVLEFKSTFASFKNSTITISKETKSALNFKCGNFGIQDITITSDKNGSDEAYLTTAVLFGETKENALCRAFVDGLVTNNVKKTLFDDYAGSIFKSYWDAPYFDFEVKNSSFGTETTKIGEVWSHYRQEDHISDKNNRFGEFDEATYKKYAKTASVKWESVSIYSDLTTRFQMDDPDYFAMNLALITFRVMTDTSDWDYEYKDVYADILIDVSQSTYNGEAIKADNVAYAVSDNIPLVTLYRYDNSEELWYGPKQAYSGGMVYPYAKVDGSDAKVVRLDRYPY